MILVNNFDVHLQALIKYTEPRWISAYRGTTGQQRHTETV